MMLIADESLKMANDAPTGTYGEETAEAVRKWQTARGIAPTGAFGAREREAYVKHKKARLFTSVFSPEPPNGRAWKAATAFGARAQATARERSTRGDASALSKSEAFAVSFFSGVAFTLAAMLAPKAIAAKRRIARENPGLTTYECARELARELAESFARMAPVVLLRARERASDVARAASRRFERFFDAVTRGGFAIRVGRFRLGTWGDAESA